MPSRLNTLAAVFIIAILTSGVALAGDAGNAARARNPHYVLYTIKDNLTSQQLSALRTVLKKYKLKTAHKLLNGKVLHGRAGATALPAEETIAADLAATGAVEFAEPDYAAKANATPNDPGYGSQWFLPNISAPTAWDTTTGSASVIVAILDSGCDPSHPDLVPNYVAGWNFYDNNSNTSDVQGHGTAVAGCVGAAGNNGAGIASVSWSSKVMPVRIAYNNAGEAYAYWSTVSQGMQWAVTHGAKIENCSYVGLAGSSTITSAAQYVHDNGGLFVACAGNDNIDPGFAANPNIIIVAGTDESNNRASFSDYGNFVTVCAPATNIYTTNNGSGYGFWYGTSFASPITCGVLALELAANPGLTNDNLRSILIQNTDDLGAAGWDTSFGYGKVNAAKAVAAAKNFAGNKAPTAVASASPTSGVAPLGVSFSGTGSSDPDGTIASYAWNFGDGSTGSGATTSHTYTTSGTYTATLTVTDNGGATASNSVIITVSPNTSQKVHVSSIVMSLGGNKRGTTATAKVTIVDQNGAVKSGATVSGNWSGVVSGSGSATTGSTGMASLTSPKTTASGTFTFTVVSVSLSGYTYDASANVVSSGSVTK